jgi:hypothetical protein
MKLGSWEQHATTVTPEKCDFALGVLDRKTRQLNDKTSAMQWSDFFTAAKIPTGDVEEAALYQRNRPAHGTRYEGDYQKLAASVHALQALFSRCVLKLTGGADHYVDFSTYGFPVRPLEEPLRGPEGDGKPAIPIPR